MMSRTLALVTPPQTGADVAELQRALKENRFGRSYYDAAVDGVYGELTAQAVYRAEYWIGVRVPDKKTTGNLLAYLTGARTLTLAMRQRRRRRLARAEANRPLRVKALEHALTQVGQKEDPPGSNRQKYGAWYGWNGVAWCAIFVSWCYANGGSRSIQKGRRWAYCPFMVADARAGRNGLSLVTNPLPGDIVLFDWNDDGVANHVGLFARWIDRDAGTFATVEGNTSPSDASNGGQVVHYGTGDYAPRRMRDVICFARLSV